MELFRNEWVSLAACQTDECILRLNQYVAPGDHGARKLIGYVSAFFIFGIFILIAAGLHWLGYSIYKDGLHPFHQIDSDPAPSAIQAPAATKSAAPETTSVSPENDD